MNKEEKDFTLRDALDILSIALPMAIFMATCYYLGG